MRNAGFYELAAQVLPTLLIAVLLELRSIVPAVVRAGRAEQAAGTPQSKWSMWDVIGIGSVITYLVAAVTVVVGESTALLVVFAGTDGWLPVLAGPANLAALGLLLLVAIAVPFVAMWSVVVTGTKN